jgi:hypothetical protein
MHPRHKVEPQNLETDYSNGWNLVRMCSTAAQWM